MSGRTGSVTIRPMKCSDLRGARRLQHQERWNQSVADWEVFLDTTPEGCFVAVAGDQNDNAAPGPAGTSDRGAQSPLVGTVTALRFDSNLCWISMLLVDRDYRGKGIGKRLMERVIAEMEGSCRSLRLDATPKGQPVYEQLGFVVDYQLERWTRDSGRGRPGTAPGGPQLEPLDTGGLEALAETDRTVFGSDRRVVLEHLLRVSPHGAWMDYGGYVLGRPGEHFYQVGPLVASRQDSVPALFAGGCSAAGGGAIVIDIVPGNGCIRGEVEAAGFSIQRTFSRMTRGPVPEEQAGQIMAIAGPELG